jgi:hypothetical protein
MFLDFPEIFEEYHSISQKARKRQAAVIQPQSKVGYEKTKEYQRVGGLGIDVASQQFHLTHGLGPASCFLPAADREPCATSYTQ